MNLLDKIRADFANHTSSGVTSPHGVDAFASPMEINANYEGPAPAGRRQTRRGAVNPSQQAVWNAIAARHPRKFARALAYVKWLDRMEARYASKILL
jgi:hypothetical protein